MKLSVWKQCCSSHVFSLRKVWKRLYGRWSEMYNRICWWNSCVAPTLWCRALSRIRTIPQVNMSLLLFWMALLKWCKVSQKTAKLIENYDPLSKLKKWLIELRDDIIIHFNPLAATSFEESIGKMVHRYDNTSIWLCQTVTMSYCTFNFYVHFPLFMAFWRLNKHYPHITVQYFKIF